MCGVKLGAIGNSGIVQTGCAPRLEGGRSVGELVRRNNPEGSMADALPLKSGVRWTSWNPHLLPLVGRPRWCYTQVAKEVTDPRLYR